MLVAGDRVSLGGVEVSPLGIGAWAWGDTAFWGYDEAMDKELQEASENLNTACAREVLVAFTSRSVVTSYLCSPLQKDHITKNVFSPISVSAAHLSITPLRVTMLPRNIA